MDVEVTASRGTGGGRGRGGGDGGRGAPAVRRPAARRPAARRPAAPRQGGQRPGGRRGVVGRGAPHEPLESEEEESESEEEESESEEEESESEEESEEDDEEEQKEVSRGSDGTSAFDESAAFEIASITGHRGRRARPDLEYQIAWRAVGPSLDESLLWEPAARVETAENAALVHSYWQAQMPPGDGWRRRAHAPTHTTVSAPARRCEAVPNPTSRHIHEGGRGASGAPSGGGGEGSSHAAARKPSGAARGPATNPNTLSHYFSANSGAASAAGGAATSSRSQHVDLTSPGKPTHRSSLAQGGVEKAHAAGVVRPPAKALPARKRSRVVDDSSEDGSDDDFV